MTFKYFDQPEQFVGLSDEKSICDLCTQEKFCFDAEAFYGTDELTSICPACLATGKLTNIDSFTCEGDIKELKRQINQLNPGFSDSQINELAEQKTVELEKTTPHLVTWQNWSWPCADGDYCKFIGYGSKPFYQTLTGNTPVEEFFKNSFYEPETDSDYLWSEIVSAKEIKNYNDSSEYGTLFYVFKSINSDKIITMWDCD